MAPMLQPSLVYQSNTFLTTSASDLIGARLQQLSDAVKTDTSEAERLLGQVATNTTAAIRSSAHDAERLISGMSTGVRVWS